MNSLNRIASHTAQLKAVARLVHSKAEIRMSLLYPPYSMVVNSTRSDFMRVSYANREGSIFG